MLRRERSAVEVFIHHQAHPTLLAGNDLKFQDLRQPPRRLLQRITGNEAHGLLASFEERIFTPVASGPGEKTAITGINPASCDSMILRAPPARRLSISLRLAFSMALIPTRSAIRMPTLSSSPMRPRSALQSG